MEKYARTMQEATGLYPVPPVTRLPHRGGSEEKTEDMTGNFFTPEIKVQLAELFERMARPLVLRLTLDERPVSEELRRFMEELCGMTDKLRLEINNLALKGEVCCSPEVMHSGSNTALKGGVLDPPARIIPEPAGALPSRDTAEHAGRETPWVGIYLEDGSYRGIAFHGVPGGHEFDSFVIGLYNAAGPGQPLEAETAEALRAVEGPVSMKILVSLTCTMCPELVMAAQRMAAENPRITADAYDLNHFPDLQEQYKVMSVPCLVINDGTVSFGKKNIRELLALLGDKHR
jgi:thioredoxin reductase (NADPH)